MPIIPNIPRKVGRLYEKSFSDFTLSSAVLILLVLGKWIINVFEMVKWSLPKR